MKFYTITMVFFALFLYGQKPVSKFSASSASSGSNITVNYNNESTASPTSYSWEFSGGTPSTSTSASPAVSYSGPGTYSAKLTVSNANGSSMSTRTIKIESGASSRIYLNTGYDNQSNTLLGDIGISDPDWTYTAPNGTVSTPITRYAASGWSFAQITTGLLESRWITGNNTITGYHYYVSKTVEIPANVTTAVLNLRCLSFIRSWTYLVKVNPDNTTTETQITNTTGTTNGWLNSQNALVSNYPLQAGTKYYIKVKAYTNTAGQRQAVDVNAQIDFGNVLTLSPRADFSATPLTATNGASVQFTNLSGGTPVSNSWSFQDGTNVINSSLANPSVIFNNTGFHDAELIADYGNGMTSSLKVNEYIETAAEPDYTLAPNSYIFTGKDETGNDVDGIYIPVRKAYQMWKKGRYMQNDDGIFTPINENDQVSASVFWEDVNGLVKSTSIEGVGEKARIRVLIDKTKGEGNASIAIKVNNIIYWTWHIWVTDNPENGAIYGQGFETNISNQPFYPQYMDRNLGATSASFLGNDWHKSGGLMYQWGRKDPLPPLEYKDGSYYEITGDIGSIRHENAALVTSKMPVKYRGLDTNTNNINGNIRYSINHPIDIIAHNLNDGTWFSSQEYKINNTNTELIETWDLWSDNRKGLHSNASSDDVTVAMDSKSYELKSEFDPCPNGWRVPSHYGRNTSNNNLNPLGRHQGNDDDHNLSYSQIYPDLVNDALLGVKAYTGRGIDFNGTNNRKIGIIPTSGNYVFYPANGNTTAKVVYQDQSSDAILLTATYGIGGSRETIIHSDGERTDVSSTGWNGIYVNQTTKTNNAGAVRCMKDPNMALLPDFYKTDFVASTDTDTTDYKSWIKEPNSFVVMTGETSNASAMDKELKISLKKAYAMHKLYLSENKEIPLGNMNTGSVVWSDNPDLVKKIEIIGVYPDQEMKITIAAGKKGNAVVAFHKGDNGVWGTSNPDKVLWSWHIWAPVTDPLLEESQITYTTESVENGGIIPTTSGHIINSAKGGTPLTTTFMDRNLGALQSLPSVHGGETNLAYKTQIQQSGGLHYQWGRKDPIPTFHYPGGAQSQGNVSFPYITVAPTYNIFRQTGLNASGNIVYSSPITDAIYSSTDENLGYSREWGLYKSYAGIATADKKNEKIRKVIKYATENPLYFLFRSKTGNELGIEDLGSLATKSTQVKDWISDENGLAQDRWGHATEKSPYDPCPGGWRVPDTAGAILFAAGNNGSYAKGSSPWFYNGYNTTSGFTNYGIQQSTISDLTGSAANNNMNVRQYPGVTLRTFTDGVMPTIRAGWVFNFSGSKYNIGNIPTTGIRGILGGNDWKNIRTDFPAADNYKYQTGLWTSSPADYYTGYAIGLNLSSVSGNGGKLASGTGFYPQAAMGVRCAKDTERYMGDLPYTVTSNKTKLSLVIPPKISENDSEVDIFPNPVKDYIHVNFKNNKESEYVIYDMAGSILKRGIISEGKINISDLTNGVYILSIKNISRIFKIIKQ
ncbi:Por secretion system C-terminal sorting domain-containing protein [Epilithonimonas hungarica]|uniref:Por secretion system C-terminal sorting domain-containing protein n=2 Tax=Epilithonimonas hungarica TaxID=454006 RepID=A0A1G7G2L5_9FLAO|nr:Por secretion system C-terminal sorting domain-containing protein [Epilithonimonas hungarica]